MSWLIVLAGVLTSVGALVVWSWIASIQINRRWPPVGQRIEVEPGLGLQVLKEGSGPPVLLLHGAASNQRELMAAFAGHLDGLTRIAIDRPGFGFSDRPRDGWRMGEQARLIGLALDQLACGPVVLAGHSWGSAIGLRLALDRPDLVKALVLLAPASHPWPGGTGLVNRLGAMPILGPLLAWTLPCLLGPFLANAGITRAFAPSPLRTDYGHLIGTPLHFRPASFVANCEDMAFGCAELAQQATRYPSLTLPVAIVSGGGDLIVSNAIHAKQLARDLPHATSLRVEQAGHMPHWIDTKACAAIIRQFAGQPGSAPGAG